MKKKELKFLYNDDSDTLRYITPPHTEEKIARAVDYLKGTQVDCLVWCVASSEAYSYISERTENYFDRYEKLDPKHFTFPVQNDLMYGLYRKGIDYLPLLIEECRKAGVAFAASFRMNDVHLKSDPGGPLSNRFWQEHQHMRLWEITDGQTYYNACLDYSYPEVRNRYLAMIEEFAGRYDIDGIELDFCRCEYLFQPSEAWGKRKILADFIAGVHSILKKAGERKGKNIFLVTRIPTGEERLKKLGMDVEVWLNKKLTDILVMSAKSNDYNLKIEPWLSMARKKGISFYPSIESDSMTNKRNLYELVSNPVMPRHSYNAPKTPGLMVKRIRGMAQQLLAQKPDGIYTFNYPCILNERANNRYNDPETFKLLTGPLSQIGDLATLRGTQKLYTYWPQCPISVETGRPARYHQSIGFSLLDPDVERKDTKAVIRFIEIAEKNPHAYGGYRQNPIVPAGRIKYAINGKPVTEKHIKRTKKPRGRIISGFLLKTHNMVEISVPFGMLINGENNISFEIPGFPEAHDPYIFIYELEAEVFPQE